MKNTQLLPPVVPERKFPPPATGGGLWQYLVDDFLEIGCSLSEDQRRFLIEELSLEECLADSLEVYPSFLIDKKLVAVMNLGCIEDCWLYDAEQRRIEKYPLKRKK